MMNGYEKHELGEDPFAPKSGGIVSAFDAFPKSKPQYVQRTSGGGKWTVAMVVVSLVLFWSELGRWWRGTEMHTFAVEKGVSRAMNINLDVVVRMKCADLHVNVQDAAGDHILAATRLTRDATNWSQWVDGKGMHKLGRDQHGRLITGEGWASSGGAAGGHDEGFGEEHIHDIVALGRRKARWGKTPRLWGAEGDSCRIFGSLELNKVQGDFHITARGHGYGGAHVEHSTFNFSHIVSELSFGPFLPSLVNPLDRTVNTASANFHKFQYFISVVPTTYSVGHPEQLGSSSIFTNQYAVTEQSGEVNDRTIPGIFVKYDIEPILLNIVESRDGFLVFLIKIINVLSGALVAGHWGYRLSDWLADVVGKRRRGGRSEGMLGSSKAGYED
ncbi:endoplasmic reticulum vesicle transporter-domain-containing protein [Lasiosphaeria miniovina]|uniref:Endoplasmic reticulum-Golgi intermediate compartment protein n=1 Tax=Lasiosphaeria miniovina TaxID=1954250 RepID=A0AA40E6N7_9PEZI|nr:endoplasmic reticulum vesicle transporter-domain-containing protein [Lasiosphaeria miniovina]KAK0727027.1 endoplasmic reticulum vesicle transporter-domain-containing protein [Lasiosphaeria miniovina]